MLEHLVAGADGIRRRADLVAGRREVHAQQLAQALVIVHYQDLGRHVVPLNVDGADAPIRTGDLLITNQLLYQLSYISAGRDYTLAPGPSPGA